MASKIEQIQLSSQGKSIEEAFSNSAVNMFSIVTDTNLVNSNLKKSLMMRSKDLKSLLYLFLRKLFDLANNELFLLKEVRDLKIESINDEYLLTAVASGDKFNQGYEVKDIVKQLIDKDIIIKEDKSGTFTQVSLIVERRNVKDEEV